MHRQVKNHIFVSLMFDSVDLISLCVLFVLSFTFISHIQGASNDNSPPNLLGVRWIACSLDPNRGHGRRGAPVARPEILVVVVGHRRCSLHRGRPGLTDTIECARAPACVIRSEQDMILMIICSIELITCSLVRYRVWPSDDGILLRLPPPPLPLPSPPPPPPLLSPLPPPLFSSPSSSSSSLSPSSSSSAVN